MFPEILGRLTRMPEGRSRRVSSNEQPAWNNANMDSTWLAPGDVLEVPILEGPGYINHIWMTSHAGGMGELNALTLRIYWDGRDEPAVEAPLGDFFACGNVPATVESFPVQVSPSGALTCYWVMPFRKSARITVTNDNRDRGYGLYWQIDYVAVDALPDDTIYFYARYRQEYPAVMGQDYLIADIEGKGLYAGTVMSVTNCQDGWFGEGDDFFFIDGEPIPSLQGTGTEDYFNDGWGFRKRTSHWFGQPHGLGWKAGDSGILYRWHVLDPVRFSKSLKVTIEHKGNWPNSEDAWFLERPDYLSSVAFWYQMGMPKDFGYLPPFHERNVPWLKHSMVAKYRDAQLTGGQLRITTMGMFGGRPSLRWSGHKAGDRLVLPFDLPEGGRIVGRLCAFLFGGSESACFSDDDPGKQGRFKILVDGKPAADNVSFQTMEYEEPAVPIGEWQLAAGTHTLAIQANDSGLGDLGIEYLRTLRLPPLAVREVKTPNEAHFFRLGIGRAVYAFRMAFGTIPHSLRQLVDLEIMDARYLNDEHGNPLQCWVEDGRLWVQSPAKGGWKHSWTGADARR